ncbi:hypothetical protein [Pontibacterium sp.]|uniref:hypothetical protein n=1 Tax=Pontibacterium sp. TaxID=2036026 RepID=UPI0035163A86
MDRLSNIEIFNGIAGKVFADLYSSFPVHSAIKLPVYAEELVDPDDYDGYWQVSEIADATLSWLVESGYIWLDENQCIDEEYRKGVLTPKGLEVLKVVPSTLSQNQSIGEKLLECSKGAFNTGLNETVKQAISIGAKALVGA